MLRKLSVLIFLLALSSSIGLAQTLTYTAESTPNVFSNTNQFQLGTLVGPQTFATLPPGIDGTFVYCSDCQLTNPCQALGAGGFAQHIQGEWDCQAGGGGGGGGGTPCSITPLSLQYNAAGTFGCVADFTAVGHAILGGTSGVLDLSAMSTVSGFRIPTATSALPTVDGFLGFSSQFHTAVFGSNGITLVFAVAGIGPNTTTACTNQVLTAISGIAAPTCSPLTGAYLPVPSVSTLGGIEAITCAGSTFINAISTLGVPICNTPAGSGNVSAIGTPTSGQIAQWTSATTIQAIGTSGTGSVALVNTPTLITPVLGVATFTSLNNVIFTPPVTAATLTFPVDNSTITFQGTDTYVGRATTDVFTHKTFDTAGTGNVFKINGVTITTNSGTGANVLATSPTLVTPTLGVALATSINGLGITTSTGTLTVANAKTLTASNSLTLAGTDSTTQTFPSVSATIAGNGSATAHNVGLYEGAGTQQTLVAPGANGTCFTSNGTTSDPSFQACPGGAVTWNTNSNATGALILANANFASTFNQTSAVNWTWANTTAAVHLTPQNSPIWNIAGTYFNGATSATDSWSFQDVLGTADNGTSTLTLAHSGSSGLLNFAVPGGVSTGTSGGAAGVIASPEGTAASGVAASEILYAGTSSSHRWTMNNNNAGALLLVGIASAGTSGHCLQLAGNGIDLADSGAACGSGSNAFPVTVTGGVSGAMPYFSSTTVESVSALLVNHAGMFGGGSGGAPTTDSAFTTDGSGNVTAASIATGAGTAFTVGTGGAWGATEGTASTGLAGADIIYALASTHRFLMKLNNGSALNVVGIASAGTSGNCPDFAANGIDLVDTGSPCGSGSSAFPITITGGVSGAVPCFTSTTVESAGTLLATNSPVIGGGAGVCPKTVAGLTFDGTSILTLGVAGTSVGTVALKNGTSGTLSLAPVTGALGTVTASFPANTGTVAETNLAETFSALQTFGTSISIGGVTAAGATGTTNVVFSNSPTLVTPTLGAAVATSVAVGTSPPTCTIGTAGTWCGTEGTAPTFASSVDDSWANSGDHNFYFNANNGVTQHLPQTMVLQGAAYTNATTGFTSVVGGSGPTLAFAIAASTPYAGSCYLVYSASAVTAGPKIQFTGPAAPTAVNYSALIQLTSSTTAPTYADSAAASAFSTSLTSPTTVASATLLAVRIQFGIINGTTAGTLTLQAASQGVGTVTLEPGSFCSMQ